MKALFKLLFTCTAACIPAVCTAQYSFSATIHGAGSSECSQATAYVNKMALGIPLSGFPTKRDCENARQQIMSLRFSGGGCTIYYTCSPCVGTDMSRSGSSDANSSNMPVQNRGVELKNDIADYEYKRDVQTMQSSFDLITTHNVDYSQTLNSKLKQAIEEQRGLGASIQMRKLIPNVESSIQVVTQSLMTRLKSGYSLEELTSSLKSTFAELTGANVDAYINASNLTLQDQEILNIYDEFCDAVLDRMLKDCAKNPEYEYKALEMAIYALHIYDDDPARGYDEWCGPLKDVSIIPSLDEQKSAQKILDFLSENNNKHDFQADFYYDAEKDTYVLAFRGTETHLDALNEEVKQKLSADVLKAISMGPPGIANLPATQVDLLTQLIRDNKGDWGSDILYLCTGTSPQHDIAAALGDLIKESGIPLEKLTITGHSLGGGLALMAGLKSGAETYAYDPLHLNAKVMENYNLKTEKETNIHCYEEEKETLVSVGEAIGGTMSNLAEAKRDVIYDEMGMNSGYGLNSLHNAISVGEITTVSIPGKDFSYKSLPIPVDPINGTIIERVVNAQKDGGASSYLNHSIIDMVKGISAIDPNKTSNFINGQNMRYNIAQFRAEKRYKQQTSAMNFSTGGIPITTISR